MEKDALTLKQKLCLALAILLILIILILVIIIIVNKPWLDTGTCGETRCT